MFPTINPTKNLAILTRITLLW